MAHRVALPERKMVHLNYENGSPEPWPNKAATSKLLVRRDARGDRFLA